MENIFCDEKEHQMCRKILAILAVLMVAGCGSYYEPEPVGIGKDVNELKLSPCACIHVELDKTLPDWFIASI